MKGIRKAQKTVGKKEPVVFDVTVIGGGPAGLMAAGTAAQAGAAVVILEKNPTLGKKLLLTGNGRCNVTQDQRDIRALVKAYGKNGPFLFSSFSAFGPADVMEFFEGLDVKLKTEELGRVFPVTDKASTVRDALESWVRNMGVEIRTDTTVTGLLPDDDGGFEVASVGVSFRSRAVIITTGGRSYPATGSTGDGEKLAKSLGHAIVEPVPALVPLKTKEHDVVDLKGVSLEDVTVKSAGEQARGAVIFTHFGLSGPAVFTVSRAVSRALVHGIVRLELDLLPNKKAADLDAEMANLFHFSPAKSLKSVLTMLLPARLTEVVCRRAKVDGGQKAGQCTAKDRQAIGATIKSFCFTVTDTLGWGTAMVTSGGVALADVNPKTLESKIAPHLFFAGEALDLDGPTGGYNLQIAWSTGHAAGLAAANTF